MRRSPGDEITLIDGLTPAQCLAEWSLEQQEVKRSRVLTPEQIGVARDLWAAQLRAQVVESDAVRRAREPSVIVDMDE